MSGAEHHDWVEQQKQFYAKRPHAHLQYTPGSTYAHRLVTRVLGAAGLQPGNRVLEVGCGAGRFTIPLLERCAADLVATDLSESLLARLQQVLQGQHPETGSRCHLVAADIYHPESLSTYGPFDCITGFFFLHHLPDLPRAIATLRTLLRPGGAMLFLEPNRRNPLFLLQVLCCADMSWAEERGMFTLGCRQLRRAFQEAGMSDPTIETFGCFPPQILDRWDWAIGVEERVERVRCWRGLLPFRLVQSRALGPGAADDAGGEPARSITNG